MKFATLALAAAFVLPVLNCAQEHRGSGKEPETSDKRKKAENAGPSRPAEPRKTEADRADQLPRRLESYTWNSVKHQLTWEVSRGRKNGEQYEPVKTDRYQIDMDKATMTFNGETRAFSEEEAQNVSALLSVLSKYAVESTVWWEDGQGDPLDGEGRPVRPRNRKPRSRPNSAPAEHVVSAPAAAPAGALLALAAMPHTPHTRELAGR